MEESNDITYDMYLDLPFETNDIDIENLKNLYNTLSINNYMDCNIMLMLEVSQMIMILNM